MAGRLTHLWRLGWAGRTLARHDVLTGEQVADLPWPARGVYLIARLGSPRRNGDLAGALYDLGPSYIKLGQFLATRPDIVGKERAQQLRMLQDKLPPFGLAEAKAAIKAGLGGDAGTLFSDFGPPVAAASIAQVHRARTREGTDVAVKILRPQIERRFSSDLESFFFAAPRMFKSVELSPTLSESLMSVLFWVTPRVGASETDQPES